MALLELCQALLSWGYGWIRCGGIMGNLVSIRLRIIAAAWMGSVAEPGDLGAAGGAPALDEHEAVAHAQRVAARERRHAAVGAEGVAQRQLPYVLGHALPYAGCLDVGRAVPAAELGFGLLLGDEPLDHRLIDAVGAHLARHLLVLVGHGGFLSVDGVCQRVLPFVANAYGPLRCNCTNISDICGIKDTREPMTWHPAILGLGLAIGAGFFTDRTRWLYDGELSIWRFRQGRAGRRSSCRRDSGGLYAW